MNSDELIDVTTTIININIGYLLKMHKQIYSEP